MIILPIQIKKNWKVTLIDQSKFVFGDIKFFGLVYKGYFWDMEVKEYKEDEYRIIFGVEKNTFNAMVDLAENQYKKDHENGGRNDGLSPRERVEITLKYVRQYVSQRYLAIEYNIAKSCIAPAIKWTLKVIASNEGFSLPNKVENIYDTSEDRIYDVTESRIDRPQKIQEKYYSGKKKMHTLKTQVEIGVETLLIYSIAFAVGSTHDFNLFKNSSHDYNKDTTLFADLGYIGIEKIHKNSIIPIKNSKNHKLNDDEKWFNSEVSKIRIAIEHVNAFLKKFKIISTRFRNRRKNFKLYMTFICCIYNYETANI